MGAGKAQHLLALRRDADGEHGHIAALGLHIGDQAGKRAVEKLHRHAQLARQLVRQVDVNARKLLGARIAQRDAVVIGPNAHLHLAAGLDTRQAISR